MIFSTKSEDLTAENFLTELDDITAKQVCGGFSRTVVGPRGLIKKLENPGVDAPGLTPEKGQKIGSNTNGNKYGWTTGTVPS